jgi:hypothetical protein
MSSAPVSFPAQALLILEERLRERQAEGDLPIDADLTQLALRLLVTSEVLSSGYSVSSWK